MTDRSSWPVHDDAEQAPAALEAIARRAYEISLSPGGGTSEANWRRAEDELAANGDCYCAGEAGDS